MKKRLILMLALLSFVCILPSCGSNGNNENKNNSKITITFATFFDEGSQADAYKDIIKKFEENNTNIVVELQPGSRGYDDKIKGSLKDGKGPDIIGLQRSSMLQYIKQGDLKDLTEWFKSSGISGKYYGVSTGYGKFQDKYYGIGDLPYTTEWFYNTDLFKKAGINEPKTLDELNAACGRLARYVQSPIVLGGNDPWSVDTFFGMISAQTVSTKDISNAFYNGTKDGYAIMKGSDEAVNIISKLVKSKYIYDVADYSYTDSLDKFVNGKAAILPMGSWAAVKIDDMKPKSFKYSIFESPVKFTDKPNSLYSATSVQVITVNNKTAHSDEVMKFIDYLFSDEAQKIFAARNGISSLKSANQDTEDPIKKIILKHLEQTDENSTMYLDNVSSGMGDTTGKVLKELINNSIKPSETWGLIVDKNFAR